MSGRLARLFDVDALGSVVAGTAAPALGASPALLALPLCALWLALALYLGAASERRARGARRADRGGFRPRAGRWRSPRER